MSDDNLHDLRLDYQGESLDSNNLLDDPLAQFEQWLNNAIAAEVQEPNAFCLSTVNKDHRPSSRMVLIKEIRDTGIVFYTNYQSKKGENLAHNPHASACFFWQPQHQQVRIQGVCSKISDEASDAYFNKRPLKSRIGAATSPQSTEIPSREWLEQQWNAAMTKHGESISRPSFWGGYLLEPTVVEFWQGQPSRLHDRFQYVKHEGEWRIVRLAP